MFDSLLADLAACAVSVLIGLFGGYQAKRFGKLSNVDDKLKEIVADIRRR